MAVVINGTTGIDTIQDDVVGLAQMASGTDGNLITYDASGNPAAVAVGTLGQVLTSNGAGAAPTMQTGGGDNTPSFSVTHSSSQSYSSGVWTKVVLDTEQHDTDSAFDSSTNYRFTVPAGEGGTYVFTGQLTHDDMVDTGNVDVTLYKNGSQVTAATVRDYAQVAFSYNMHIPFTFTLDLNASDYVELWAIHGMGGTRYISQAYTRFIGFKLAGV